MSVLVIEWRFMGAQITNKPLLHRRNWLDSKAQLKYTGAETLDEWREENNAATSSIGTK